VGLYH